MGDNNKIIKIFIMPQQFPCGPQSSCCGPIGQSDEEVAALKNAIGSLGLEVEIHDIKKEKDVQERRQVYQLFRNFGPQIFPVITVNDDIACMGQSEAGEIISAIKGKLE